MRRIGKAMIAAALPLVAGATAARAQLAGIPVYFNPRGGTGIGVSADLGFPNNNAGGGTAYGVAGSFGAGPVTLTGMVGAWKGTGFGSAETSFGADLGYRLFGGGLLPVAVGVQAGYGSVKIPAIGGTVTATTIPVGIALALNPPLFPLKPWVAPHMDFTSVSGGGGNASNFHVSAGVNFNLLLGLGVHAAVDWGKIKGTDQTSLVWGVGAHFNFHVPVM
ncbi:MAG TPA: hypothetical protein VMF70_11850 [Gemmatimonadales bacterium]|nr:hypothetical protein [Gemmatimonadales bacterium]